MGFFGKEFLPLKVVRVWDENPIPGSVQDQIGQSLEQPDTVKGVELDVFLTPSNPNHSTIP